MATPTKSGTAYKTVRSIPFRDVTKGSKSKTGSTDGFVKRTLAVAFFVDNSKTVRDTKISTDDTFEGLVGAHRMDRSSGVPARKRLT